MALSTNQNSCHSNWYQYSSSYDVGGLFSVGVATFSNFKTGSTFHSKDTWTGINVLGVDLLLVLDATIYDDGGCKV